MHLVGRILCNGKQLFDNLLAVFQQFVADVFRFLKNFSRGALDLCRNRSQNYRAKTNIKSVETSIVANVSMFSSAGRFARGACSGLPFLAGLLCLDVVGGTALSLFLFLLGGFWVTVGELCLFWRRSLERLVAWQLFFEFMGENLGNRSATFRHGALVSAFPSGPSRWRSPP